MIDQLAVERAYRYADKAHHGQLRKYILVPYICHPVAVAMKVASQPGATTEMVQAALLHDVVEDTSFTQDAVLENFGPVVGEYVRCLTNCEKSFGNRATRNVRDNARLFWSCREVQIIKVCDILHNVSSIRDHDPKFWKVYKEEKLEQLNVLLKVEPRLLKEAYEEINK